MNKLVIVFTAVLIAFSPALAASKPYVPGVKVNGYRISDAYPSHEGWSWSKKNGLLTLNGAGPFKMSGKALNGDVRLHVKKSCTLQFEDLNLLAVDKDLLKIDDGCSVTIKFSGSGNYLDYRDRTYTPGEKKSLPVRLGKKTKLILKGGADDYLTFGHVDESSELSLHSDRTLSGGEGSAISCQGGCVTFERSVELGGGMTCAGGRLNFCSEVRCQGDVTCTGGHLNFGSIVSCAALKLSGKNAVCTLSGHSSFRAASIRDGARIEGERLCVYKDDAHADGLVVDGGVVDVTSIECQCDMTVKGGEVLAGGISFLRVNENRENWSAAGSFKIYGGRVIAQYIRGESGIGAPSFVMEGGYVELTCYDELQAIGPGQRATIDIRVLGETIRSTDNLGPSAAVKVTGGRLIVRSPNNAFSGIACSKMTITGGSVYCTPGLGRAEAGSDRPNVCVKGGSLVVETDKGRRYTYNADYKSGLSSETATGTAYPVLITGLPPNRKVAVTGLPISYGVEDLYASDDGRLCLWLPARSESYRFKVGNDSYQVDLSSDKAQSIWSLATVAEARKVSENREIELKYVAGEGTIDWNGGREYVQTRIAGQGLFLSMPTAQRPGFIFDGWRHGNELVTGETPVPDENWTLTAQWRADPSLGDKIPISFVAVDAGAQPQTQVVFFEPGASFDSLPTGPSLAGHSFVGWKNSAGDILQDWMTVDGEDRTMYAVFSSNSDRVTVVFDAAGGVVEESSRIYTAGQLFGSLPTPSRGDRGYRFRGWSSTPGGTSMVNANTQVERTDSCLVAVWSLDPPRFPRNQLLTQEAGGKSMADYVGVNVENLGVVMPDRRYGEDGADLAEVGAVEGLPKGLSVRTVSIGSRKCAFLLGVPTETFDPKTQNAYVTLKDTRGHRDRQKLIFEVYEPAPATMTAVRYKEDYGASLVDRLIYDGVKKGSPYVAVATLSADIKGSGWKISGLPKGISYTSKATTYTDKSGKLWDVPANSFYGSTKNIGLWKVTATREGKPKILSGTVLSEKREGLLSVYPKSVKDGAAAPAKIAITGHAPWDDHVKMKVGKLASVKLNLEIAADKSAVVEGLPDGLNFTGKKRTVDGFTEKVPAGSVYGKPKTVDRRLLKVTLDKETKYCLLELYADQPSGAIALSSFEADRTASDAASGGTGSVTVPQGAAYALAVSSTSGAKVSAEGLPKGLELVYDKKTKKYSIAGVPTKAGDFNVRLTIAKNGRTAYRDLALKVKSNPFKGEFRGYMVSRTKSGGERRLGTVVLTVASGGSAKLSLSENGRGVRSASLTSYAYSPEQETARFDFVLKRTSAEKKAGEKNRYCTVFIVDAGRWKELSGTVALKSGGKSYGEIGGRLVTRADGVSFDRTRTWCFRTEADVGLEVPLASVSATFDSEERTADVKCRLRDGTLVSLANVPVIRTSGTAKTGAASDYALAPFMVADAAGNAYLVNGLSCDPEIGDDWYSGFVDWIDADGETLREVEADYGGNWQWGTRGLSESFGMGDYGREGLYVSCDAWFNFGTSGRKTFQVSFWGTPAGYDVTKNEGTVLVENFRDDVKISKSTGGVTVKFSEGKYTYTSYLHYIGPGEFRGIVVKSWTAGGKKKYLYGTADFIGGAW